MKADVKSSKKKENKNHTNLIIGAVVATLAFIFLIGVVGVYGFLSINIFFRAMGKIIPYPIILIDGHFITYGDYADNYMTLRRFSSSQGEVTYSTEEIRDRILERLITNRILEDMAKKRNIKVFDYEIDREYQEAINDLDSEKAIADSIHELFGWSIGEYKENVVRPFVLQKKLSQAIFDDEPDAEGKFSRYLQEERATASVWYLVPH